MTPPPFLSEPQTRALKILAGCPDGATEYSINHDLRSDQLVELVNMKLISIHYQRVTSDSKSPNKPTFEVVRFRITDTGRSLTS